MVVTTNPVTPITGTVLDLVDNWPPMGPGNHSDRAKLQDKWIKELAKVVKDLKKEVEALKLENGQLKSALSLLHDSNKDYDKRICTIETSGAAPSKESVRSYADVLSDQRGCAQIVAVMEREAKEKIKREKNVVIRGLPEDLTNPGHDSTAVKSVLSHIGVSTDVLKSSRRLGKPILQEGVPSRLRHRPLLVELDSRETRDSVR